MYGFKDVLKKTCFRDFLVKHLCKMRNINFNMKALYKCLREELFA